MSFSIDDSDVDEDTRAWFEQARQQDASEYGELVADAGAAEDMGLGDVAASAPVRLPAEDRITAAATTDPSMLEAASRRLSAAPPNGASAFALGSELGGLASPGIFASQSRDGPLPSPDTYSMALARQAVADTRAVQDSRHPLMEQLDSLTQPRVALDEWRVGERYALQEIIGRGAYGEVARASDQKRRRPVAIKRLRNMFENLVDAERVYREIFLLRRLQHPSIIRLVDVICPADVGTFSELYLVFEFVDTDMYKLITSPQFLTDDHIQRFFYQIVAAMHYLHSAGVMHRDLKPANVLVNEDCSLKVCDFGLARTMPRDRSGVSGSPPPSPSAAWPEASPLSSPVHHNVPSAYIRAAGGGRGGGGGGGGVHARPGQAVAAAVAAAVADAPLLAARGPQPSPTAGLGRELGGGSSQLLTVPFSPAAGSAASTTTGGGSGGFEGTAGVAASGRNAPGSRAGDAALAASEVRRLQDWASGGRATSAATLADPAAMPGPVGTTSVGAPEASMLPAATSRSLSLGDGGGGAGSGVVRQASTDLLPAEESDGDTEEGTIAGVLGRVVADVERDERSSSDDDDEDEEDEGNEEDEEDDDDEQEEEGSEEQGADAREHGASNSYDGEGTCVAAGLSSEGGLTAVASSSVGPHTTDGGGLHRAADGNTGQAQGAQNAVRASAGDAPGPADSLIGVGITATTSAPSQRKRARSADASGTATGAGVPRAEPSPDVGKPVAGASVVALVAGAAPDGQAAAMATQPPRKVYRGRTASLIDPSQFLGAASGAGRHGRDAVLRVAGRSSPLLPRDWLDVGPGARSILTSAAEPLGSAGYASAGLSFEVALDSMSATALGAARTSAPSDGAGAQVGARSEAAAPAILGAAHAVALQTFATSVGAAPDSAGGTGTMRPASLMAVALVPITGSTIAPPAPLPGLAPPDAAAGADVLQRQRRERKRARAPPDSPARTADGAAAAPQPTSPGPSKQRESVVVRSDTVNPGDRADVTGESWVAAGAASRLSEAPVASTEPATQAAAATSSGDPTVHFTAAVATDSEPCTQPAHAPFNPRLARLAPRPLSADPDDTCGDAVHSVPTSQGGAGDRAGDAQRSTSSDSPGDSGADGLAADGAPPDRPAIPRRRALSIASVECAGLSANYGSVGFLADGPGVINSLATPSRRRARDGTAPRSDPRVRGAPLLAAPGGGGAHQMRDSSEAVKEEDRTAAVAVAAATRRAHDVSADPRTDAAGRATSAKVSTAAASVSAALGAGGADAGSGRLEQLVAGSDPRARTWSPRRLEPRKAAPPSPPQQQQQQLDPAQSLHPEQHRLHTQSRIELQTAGQPGLPQPGGQQVTTHESGPGLTASGPGAVAAPPLRFAPGSPPPSRHPSAQPDHGEVKDATGAAQPAISSAGEQSASGEVSAARAHEGRTPATSSGASGRAALRRRKLRRQLTRHVVTRWYRAPEVILQQDYSFSVDVWSAGCILAELLSMQRESVADPSRRQALFPGLSCFPLTRDPTPSAQDRRDQLAVILDVLGTPPPEMMRALPEDVRQEITRNRDARPRRDLSQLYPAASPDALDLLRRMLCYSPNERISFANALQHPYIAGQRQAALEQRAPHRLDMDFLPPEPSAQQLRALIAEEVKHFTAERMVE